MTDPSRTDRWARAALGAFLAGWVAARTWHAYHALFRPPDALYDWNVFYMLVPLPGRYVRRGVLGEAFLLLSDLVGTDPRVVVLFVLTAATVGVGLFLYRLGRDQPFLALSLLASPAVLTFHIFDHEAVVRHEILFYLTFLLVLHAKRYAVIPAVLGAAAWPFLHEGVALFLPWLLLPWLLRGGRGDLRFAAFFLGAMAVAEASAVVLAHRESGEDIATAICDVLRAEAPTLPGLDRCASSGPVTFESRGLRDALSMMVHIVAREDLLRGFFPAFSLSLMGLGLAAARRARRLVQVVSERPRVWIAAFCVLTPLPLFLIGYDWGRWLHIYATLASIALLHARSHVDPVAERASGARPGQLFALAQPLFWRLHHAAGAEPGLWAALRGQPAPSRTGWSPDEASARLAAVAETDRGRRSMPAASPPMAATGQCGGGCGS